MHFDAPFFGFWIAVSSSLEKETVVVQVTGVPTRILALSNNYPFPFEPEPVDTFR